MEIIEPPPEMRTHVEETARIVSEHGLEVEGTIMYSNRNNPDFDFSFLRNSDHPYHAFYQQKLTEFLAAPQNEKRKRLTVDPPDTQPRSLLLGNPLKPHKKSAPHMFAFRQLPQGMTVKELDIMKLTAQFVARYGKPFWLGLMERTMKSTQFDFMRRSDKRYDLFCQLNTAYSEVVSMRPEEVKFGFIPMVLEGFFHFLQRLEEKDYDKRPQEMDLIDWYAFMSGVDWKEGMMMNQQPHIQLCCQFPAGTSPTPEEAAPLPLPEEPKPKKPKSEEQESDK